MHEIHDRRASCYFVQPRKVSHSETQLTPSTTLLGFSAFFVLLQGAFLPSHCIKPVADLTGWGKFPRLVRPFSVPEHSSKLCIIVVCLPWMTICDSSTRNILILFTSCMLTCISRLWSCSFASRHLDNKVLWEDQHQSSPYVSAASCLDQLSVVKSFHTVCFSGHWAFKSETAYTSFTDL